MSGTIDGRKWAAERLRYLQELLESGRADLDVQAIAEEMEQLRREAGFLTEAGMRRWLRRTGRPASQ